MVPRCVSERLALAEKNRCRKFFSGTACVFGGVSAAGLGLDGLVTLDVLLTLDGPSFIMVDRFQPCLLRESSQTEGFQNTYVNVYDTEAADGPAKKWVKPKMAPFRTQIPEQVGFPKIAPWEKDEEKPNLKVEHHEQYAGEFVIPAISGVGWQATHLESPPLAIVSLQKAKLVVTQASLQTNLEVGRM